jgi:PilZ domain
MQDRRLSKRLSSLLEGRIRLDPQAPQIPCTIRDLSVTGSRHWVPDVAELPDELELEIPKREQSVRVRLIRSEAKSHGVMFLEQLRPPANDEGLGLLEKLRTPEFVTYREVASEEVARLAKAPSPKRMTGWQRLMRLLSRTSD